MLMQEKSCRLPSKFYWIRIQHKENQDHEAQKQVSPLEDGDEFVYFGFEMGGSSRTETNISRRLSLVRGALVKLMPEWNSTAYR